MSKQIMETEMEMEVSSSFFTNFEKRIHSKKILNSNGNNTKHQGTSHSAYVATSTESHGLKIDGFLYPNFM